MHHSIASRARPRPRQLASLCAACARVATFSSSSPSGTSSNTPATPLPQRPSPSPPRPHAGLLPRPAPPTAAAAASRWFSRSTAAASPAAQGPQDAAAAQGPGARQTRQQQSGEPDYYALFPQTLAAGPPPDGPFEIDVRALRREFLRLQAAVHPDFHHHASSSSSSSSSSASSAAAPHSAARRQAEAASAHVNAAFKTLSSPLQRAQYLLRRRHGLDLAGDEAAALAAPDASLLAQVMAARELIEDAAGAQELEPLRAENDARIAADEAALAAAFARDDPDAAVALVVRLRYWLNVRDSLDDWEPGRPVVMQH
ncbi:hypothetical protein RB595_001094 [Gaeumannomyces hyphopodioides]